jgi:cytochrome c2
MFRLTKGCVPILSAILLAAIPSFATTEIGKKEKKGCPTCHDLKKGKPTKENPNLNKTGDFYKEKKTLQGAPTA